MLRRLPLAAALVATLACTEDSTVVAPAYVTLTTPVAAAVDTAIQDEFRAEQIYLRVLVDHGNVLPFYNIVVAEQRHSTLARCDPRASRHRHPGQRLDARERAALRDRDRGVRCGCGRRAGEHRDVRPAPPDRAPERRAQRLHEQPPGIARPAPARLRELSMTPRPGDPEPGVGTRGRTGRLAVPHPTPHNSRMRTSLRTLAALVALAVASPRDGAGPRPLHGTEGRRHGAGLHAPREHPSGSHPAPHPPLRAPRTGRRHRLLPEESNPRLNGPNGGVP
jgi:hypothetical protein